VKLPTGVSAQLRDLITSLLDPSPQQRLTAREALKHEWFTGIVKVRKKASERDR
jgi:serine/threonine protein kinase